jgi:tRNA ligase
LPAPFSPSSQVADRYPDVASTQWDSLESHTLPPYHLTLKSNGCLIMISAIEEDVLLVTSKHALGKSGGPDGEEEGGKSHAEMGLVLSSPKLDI